MKFKINEKHSLIFIITFLIFGFCIDVSVINYLWYFFYFKWIAGILLLIIWFQLCKKYSVNRVSEGLEVMFSGIAYIFFITIIETIELTNNGIKVEGLVQNFKKSYSRKDYGSYPILFITDKQEKYEGKIHGKIGLYKQGETVSVIYSQRIPEINHAE